MNQLDQAAHWFAQTQKTLCEQFEAIENQAPDFSQTRPAQFQRQAWQRKEGGGGQMAMLRKGRLIEKGGVHISDISGALPKVLAQSASIRSMPEVERGGTFRACGISVIIHTRNPHAPSAHMNMRHIQMGKRSWFGGCADLTPMLPAYRSPAHPDSIDFHAAFKKTCAAHSQFDYEQLRKWCADYFTLPHRGQERGIGGVFYDDLNSGDWDADFAFTQAIGTTFLDIYPKLLHRRMKTQWTEAERHTQAIQRSRYVEFNLLYDRGTQFGLLSGGNVESILSSMPPLAIWE